MAHLSRPGKEIPYGDHGDLLDSNIGERAEGGLQRMEHFQPKRTHEIGYAEDGTVTDWISVWTH